MITKNKLFTNINWLLTIVTILVIIFLIKDCTGWRDGSTREIVYEYKTDTIYKDSDYKEKYEKLIKEVKVKYIKTPPEKIIIYRDNLVYNEIELTPDSIMVKLDSLGKALAISKQYIAKYIQADKLIDFKLDLDHLNITTLAINGEVSNKEYPLYLYDFEYVWINNELNRNPKKRNKPGKYTFNQLYFKSGYEFIKEKPYIGLEYDIILGRIKLGLDTNLIFDNTDNIEARAKIGYRLF